MDYSILKNTSLPDHIKNVEVVNLIGELPQNPRYSWEQLKGARPINDLKTVVCHHTALSKSSTSKYSDVEIISRIAKSHINSTRNVPGGDAGVPYTAIIRSGKLYVCNKITDLTFSVASNNTYTVNLSIDGDYTKDKLEEADLNALLAGVLIYKLNMPSFKNVLSHGEITPTSCPGYSIQMVREELSKLYPLADKPPIDAEVLAKIEEVKARVNDLYATATGTSKYNKLAQGYLTSVYEFMKSGTLI